MKTMFQLAWTHRAKVMRQAGTSSRYYLRSLRDTRGILNRKARHGTAVPRPLIERGAAVADGRIHFKSMTAFQQTR